MPGGSGDYEVIGDESDECDAIPTARRQSEAATEIERFDLVVRDDDGYEGEAGDAADADEVKEASEASDGSTQTVEQGGHSMFDLGTGDVDRYE
jgi:hypothetical protein